MEAGSRFEKGSYRKIPLGKDGQAERPEPARGDAESQDGDAVQAHYDTGVRIGLQHRQVSASSKYMYQTTLR
jgi:hypothetical protein